MKFLNLGSSSTNWFPLPDGGRPSYGSSWSGSMNGLSVRPDYNADPECCGSVSAVNPIMPINPGYPTYPMMPIEPVYPVNPIIPMTPTYPMGPSPFPPMAPFPCTSTSIRPNYCPQGRNCYMPQPTPR